MAALSQMCGVALLEQVGRGIPALGTAVESTLRLFKVRDSKASTTAWRVSVFTVSVRLKACSYAAERKEPAVL